MKAGLFTVFVALLSASQLSFAKEPESEVISAVWDLAVAADGSIEQLSIVSSLPPALVTQLEGEIRRWSFRPGAIDGKPVSSRTSLTVELGLEPLDSKSMRVKILSGETGSRAVKAVSPQYPDSSVKQRRGGMVVLIGKFDASGKVTDVELHKDSPVKSGALMKAAKASVLHYQMQPENVGGRAVAGNFVVPICFTLYGPSGQMSSGSCDWKRSDSESVVPNGQALAVNPEVTLETEVKGRIL